MIMSSNYYFFAAIFLLVYNNSCVSNSKQYTDLESKLLQDTLSNEPDSLLFVTINNFVANGEKMDDEIALEEFANKIINPPNMIYLSQPDSSYLFSVLRSIKQKVHKGGLATVFLNSHTESYDSILGNSIRLKDKKLIYTNSIMKFLCDSVLDYANVLFINGTCFGILNKETIEKNGILFPSCNIPSNFLEQLNLIDLTAKQYHLISPFIKPYPKNKFNYYINDTDFNIYSLKDSTYSNCNFSFDSILIVNNKIYHPFNYYHIGFNGILSGSATKTELDWSLTYFGKFLKGYSSLESDFKLMQLYALGKEFIADHPQQYYHTHDEIEPYFYVAIFDTTQNNVNKLQLKLMEQKVQIQKRIMIIRNNKSTH
jgi:hypothetical protein